MKKLLLLPLFILCTQFSNAQICTIDTTFTQPGIYPDTLPPGTVGQPYSTDITFVMPLDTLGYNFTNFKILTVSLPVGLSWQCSAFANGCNYDPQVNQYGCVNISGTPLLAGSYPINVTVIADLTVASGIPVTFNIYMDVLPANSSASNNGFSMTNFEGCSPITVNFVNNNPGLISYFWDFGNGNQSSAENPVPQVYNAPGDYYVHYEAFNDTTTNHFYTITDIAVTSLQNSTGVWGWPADGNPDIYVIVKENGNIVYQSGFTPDTYPLVSWGGLNINMNPANTYVLEVWDEDNSEFGFGADDYIGNHTMSLNGCVGCAANISVVDYTVNHVIVPPSPSVFTDDTIHVYGYPGKPNIYYDSLNHVLHTDSLTNNIQWYFNASPQLGQNGATDTVWNSGDYFVIAVNQFGCTTFSDTITAVYCDTSWHPIVTKNSNILTSLDTANNTLQWYNGGVAMPGQTSYQLVTMGNGLYTLEVTNQFGCKFLSAPVNINVSISEIENFVSKIYPNPAGDFLNISTLSEFPLTTIQFFDVTGRKVMMENCNSNFVKINLNEIPVGIYTVQISSGVKTVNKKIVVAR